MSYPLDTRSFEEELLACGAKDASLPFAVAATDPFHNADIDVVGSPDHVTGRSYVHRISKELTISAPAGTTTNWDCHIATIPYVGTGFAVGADVNTPSAGQIQSNPAYVGNLVNLSNIVHYNSVPSGDSTFTPSTSTSAMEIGGIDLQAEFLDGDATYRITAMGYQVHNTTAEINLQGACTVYEQAMYSDKPEYWSAYTSAGAFREQRPSEVIQMPPRSLSNAKELQGKTWKALEGAYVVSKIDHENNGPIRFGPRNFIGLSTPSAPRCIVGANWSMGNDPVSTFGMPLRFRQSGSYFSGLSPETSLTVTVVCHLEVFPFPGTALVSIAKNSLAADPQVLECVDVIQRDMPAGVEVKFNPTGKFFKHALNALRTSGKVFATMQDPRLKMTGNAINAGFKAADALSKHKKKKKR